MLDIIKSGYLIHHRNKNLVHFAPLHYLLYCTHICFTNMNMISNKDVILEMILYFQANRCFEFTNFTLVCTFLSYAPLKELSFYKNI